MRIIMRIFFLMCILGASLTIAAQNIIYGNKNEQRAINMAFDILQVYYHSKELCVSDSIYDLDWDIFSDMVDTQTKQILWSYRIEKKFIWNAPTYSEALLSIFGPETCDSCMYIANFSEPYKGMIRCDILPKDKMVGIYGSPVISAFLFKYLLAELKNRLKISIFLWRKKLCISLIFSNFVVSNYKVIYFTLCTTCMQIS